MNIHTNLRGTTADQFRIGKSGPTIYQGGAEPSPSLGRGGDLFIRHGTVPRLYTRDATRWVPSGNPSLAFERETVIAGGALDVAATTTFVGVIGPPMMDAIETTVTLTGGWYGQSVTIKDEGATAQTCPITIVGADGELIDGSPNASITTNRGAMTLTFGPDGWFITRVYAGQ